MRPIPAPRIGHTHGLLKALDERGKLRLEEFVTEFSERELFPPDAENASGRTRQFVAYARAAGLVKEVRGSIELTDLGKRYVKAADRRDVFAVSPGQAEWLRRQLREKHLTESIWNGAAIGLSLYSTLQEAERVALLDFGRAAAHLGRAGWDNENTFRTQGERITDLLRDMGLVDEERRLTDAGRETIADLRLPIHVGLLDLAGQLNPGGPEGAAAAAASEYGGEPAPAVASNGSGEVPVPAAAEEAGEREGGDEHVEVGAQSDAAGAASEPEPEPEPELEAPPAEPEAQPAEPEPAVSAPESEPVAAAPGPIEAAALAAGGAPIAGPEEPTRSYDVSDIAATRAAQSDQEDQMAQAPEGDQPAPTPAPASGPPPVAPEPEPQPQPAAAPPKPDSGTVRSPFASGIRPTTAMAAIKPEDLAAWKAEQQAVAAPAGAAKKEGPFLEVGELQKAAEKRGLVIDPGVYASAIAALASGRHLVLTGGAGSGKTSLALAIAEAAVRAGRCKGVVFTSAGAGLNTGETLGRRKRDDGSFAPGLVPAAIENDRWLVIDELDRVRLDRALGRVSTVLGGHPIDLPGGGELKPPANWRVIATMRDIDQVGAATPALRRRFVFVEVPVLERADLEKLAETWAGGDEVAAAVGKRLVAINDVIELGPGLYKDAIAYVAARRKLAPASETDLTLEALAGFVLPQLEGEDESVQAAAVAAAGLGG